jgi:hypothetical protein
MSTPTGDDDSLYELHFELEAEISLAESSHPEEAADLPISDWLFDPTDVEREEIGLRGLLDAVDALEGDSHPDEPRAGNA